MVGEPFSCSLYFPSDPVLECGVGGFKTAIMDSKLQTAIERSFAILDYLWDQVKSLEDMGLAENDIVFTLMEERMQQEFRKIEVLSFYNWELRYWLHNTEATCKN